MVRLLGLGMVEAGFFPLTVTGGGSPVFFYGEGPFFSIGLYSTWLKKRFFVGKSFWYSKMVYLQPIDSCQRGIEFMPPRKAIDWTNDDDLIRRLERGGVHWPWRISRGFLLTSRPIEIPTGDSRIYHDLSSKIGLMTKDGHNSTLMIH